MNQCPNELMVQFAVLQHGAGMFQRGIGDLAAGEPARQFPHSFFLAGKVGQREADFTIKASFTESCFLVRRSSTLISSSYFPAALAGK